MHVWALGLSCETPAAPPDRAAGARTRQPENSKRAHLSAPALQTPPKFHEKIPREERKERILRRDREKKREILGPPPFGSPPFEPPPFRAPPFGAPPFEAPPFEPHPSNPHPSNPHPSNPHFSNPHLSQLKTHRKNLNN